LSWVSLPFVEDCWLPVIGLLPREVQRWHKQDLRRACSIDYVTDADKRARTTIQWISTISWEEALEVEAVAE
jgi:hypothetical protein